MQPNLVFIIDTEQYAGQFERSMCAYLTGQPGDSDMDAEELSAFQAEVLPSLAAQLASLVGRFTDESGATWPVDIVPTPCWFNHGLGGHYRDTPEAEAKALAEFQARNRAHEQRTRDQIEELLALCPTDPGAPNAVERVALQRHLDACPTREAEVDAMTVPHKHPAFLSVAIALTGQPSQELLVLMKSRAVKYAAVHGLTVTGFRMQTPVVQEVSV